MIPTVVGVANNRPLSYFHSLLSHSTGWKLLFLGSLFPLPAAYGDLSLKSNGQQF